MKGQRVPRISTTTATIVLTICLAVLLLAIANQLHRQVALSFKRQNVADLAASTLKRAEIATDYAIIRLGVLREEGHTDCSETALDAINYAVFRSGTIKDIVTANGEKVCSVAMHGETLRKNHVSPVDSATGRNPNIVFNPLRVENTPAMAITWKFNETTLATALVNTEALVFDILPADLRESSAVKLSLTNGRTIGSYEGPGWKIGGSTEMFEVRSERYPLIARIHIPVALLKDLDIQRNLATEIGFAVLVSLLAYLAARGLVPTPNAAGRIRQALARNEITPVFQPAYDVRNGEVTAFEVLARWPGQSGPNASPAFFVPLIEANGWANELLEGMIMQTAHSMRSVIETAPEVKFAFNVSPAQMIDPSFPSWLAKVLGRAKLDPKQVAIEITEREEIGDIDRARENIRSLAAMGVRVAIDDAGTGHNGLASVQRLGASMLKIDKLFVDGIEQDPRAKALVQMFVAVAREFEMRTVAEGVENENQLAALRQLGVDIVQGFYLCRPLQADTATRELARHRAVLAHERMQQQYAKEAAIASGKVVAIGG